MFHFRTAICALRPFLLLLHTKKKKTSCLGLLFCIPESFYGEISLDKVLIQGPDWNQGDCESDSQRPEGVTNPRIWIET